jgi:hypothetical protein
MTLIRCFSPLIEWIHNPRARRSIWPGSLGSRSADIPNFLSLGIPITLAARPARSLRETGCPKRWDNNRNGARTRQFSSPRGVQTP